MAVTQRQIAEHLGISHQAVSFALGKRPGEVSEATRQRVLAAARELGYRANSAALAISTGRFDAVGFVMGSDSTLSTIQGGVLVGPFREGILDLGLEYRHFALATPGFQLLEPSLHCSLPDEFNNMLLCVLRLRELGYQRIGFFTNEELNLRSGLRWTGAFLGAMATLGFPGQPPLLVAPDLEPSRFLEWFNHTRPEVVISTEKYVLRWLREAGHSVPEKVGFVSTGANEGWFEEPVSGIDERPRHIGATSVDLVVAQLHRNEAGLPDIPKIVMTRGQWTGDFTVRRRDGYRWTQAFDQVHSARSLAMELQSHLINGKENPQPGNQWQSD